MEGDVSTNTTPKTLTSRSAQAHIHRTAAIPTPPEFTPPTDQELHDCIKDMRQYTALTFVTA